MKELCSSRAGRAIECVCVVWNAVTTRKLVASNFLSNVLTVFFLQISDVAAGHQSGVTPG